MPATLDFHQMTVPDKLRLMESLWKDLSSSEAEIASPDWHGDLLRNRDQLIESGKETFIDWEVAKVQLRNELL